MSIKIQLQAAMAAHQAHLYNEAEKLYLAILETEPQCKDALILLGILYGQQKKYQEAADHFKQALDQDPTFAQAHNHLATCLMHLGEYSAALTHIEKALALDPEQAEIYYNLGNIYQQIELWDQAKNAYKKALEIKPDYIDSLINLGTLCLKQDAFDEAEDYFKQILRLIPQHAAANFQLGNIAYQQKHYAVAIEYYEKIPTHANALLNWGSILLEQNQTELAREKFNAVLMLNPKHLLAHSNLAAMYLIEQKYDLAIPHYYEIITQDAENYTAHFNLGAIYMKQRKWDSAVYHLAVAVRLKDDDPDAHDNYATTLLKLKQENLAREHYLKALALRPDDPIAGYRLAALTGQTLPSAAPAAYITSLFDNYAENFDHELMDALQYKVPEAIYHYAGLYLLDRWNLTIVDLGCGTGLCGRYFRPRALNLIGVDLSSEMLKIARKKHIYDELIQQDMVEVLTKWDQQIDLITAADSFVYVGDLNPLFKNIYSALAKDGLLIFTLEKDLTQNFQLHRSGRYSHHENYIKQLAEQYQFTLIELVNLKLREEKGKPVEGWLVVLQKL